MGFEPPITIEKVIQGIPSQKYVLPAIQREFVWSLEQIERLFDSLMRGYPIGSFLFWRLDPSHLHDYQFFKFMDRYHERDHYHNEPTELMAGQEHIAVLDGQQRLTALNIGLRGWYAEKLPYKRWDNESAFPRKYLFLNLVQPTVADQPYQFEMRTKDDSTKEANRAFWFKVGKILDFREQSDVFDYCVENGLVTDKKKYAPHALLKLWKIIREDTLINYFAEEEQNLDKVLNIFIRVNSGGTILDYSDMLLSIASAQWKEKNAREEIHDLVDDLNSMSEGFNFDKDFVLKSCLVLTDTKAIEFKMNSFKRETMYQIERSWEKIKLALSTTTWLLSDWGYSGQKLPSANATIPLAYWIYKLGCPNDFTRSVSFEKDRKTMQSWFRVALLKRTFSGQSDSVLRQVREILQGKHDHFPDGAIREKLKPTTKSMEFGKEEMAALLDYKYGQPYTYTILSLLYPWLDFSQNFHIDHIFPKAMFTKKRLRQIGIPEERWHEWFDHFNDLANLQLLQSYKNISKRDEEFEKWLLGECPKPKDLAHYREMHMIPDINLSMENFPQFLKLREQLLLEHLNSSF